MSKEAFIGVPLLPSLHIENARIWTGDLARPWATSLTIENGRVLWLDADEASIPRHAMRIDAQRRMLSPGLIDSHLHLLKGGESLSRLDLSSAQSREDFEALLLRRHHQLSQDQWLIAHGWSQENWGGQLPTKNWLAALGDRPCVCYRMDMHIALVNDAVLSLCDLSRDPAGGTIVRDAQGDPTGLMIEGAAWQLVNPQIPKSDIQARREQLIDAQRHVNSLGITAVGTMEYQHDVDEVFAPMRDQLSLRCRATLLDRDWPLDTSFGRSFRNDDVLAVIGYKAFIDGTLGSRTARMLSDYADDQGNRGMFVELAEQGVLQEWAAKLSSENLSPSMHAIGDEAARLALDMIDQIGTAARPRIEHAQQLDLMDIPRFGNRIASMQPLHKADDCRYVRQRLGTKRLRGTFAFRQLRNAGAILAFGSDWPVVSPDPMLGMRTAITGLLADGTTFGEDENLTVDETWRAYTSDAAFALGMDHAGSLRPGAYGDVVMLDRNPFDCDWRIQTPRVIMTIFNGRIVYDASNEKNRLVQH